MREGPANYPMLRRRRAMPLGRRLRRLLAGRAMRLFAGAALLVGVVAGVAMLAARSDRPDSAAAYAAGEKALARGNYSAARNHFADAVRGGGDVGRAQVALGRALILLGDGAAADGALARALAAGVPADRLHPLRAAALVLQDQPDAAMAEARQATGNDLSYAKRAFARALAVKGDRGGAAQLLREVIAAAPADAGAWTDLGRVRLDMGDIGGAGAAAARAATLDPTSLAALTLRGEVVRSQYGLVASLPWFEAALKRDAYYHPALIEYAGTLGDVGRNVDSVAAAQRALAARPGSPQALYLMAVVAARAGKLELASDLLDRTYGALDGLPGGLLLAGAVDYASGRYEQAVARWRALVGEQPMSVTARRLLGAAMLRSGDADGALATLRPIALRADADSYTLGLVGRAFEAKGQRDWAARFLDRAARPQERASRPFGQDDDQTVLAIALGKAPDDPTAAVGYIRGLVEHGQDAEARARAQALARAAPGAPAARLLIGDVDAAAGRWSDAARSYAAAANLSFDRPTMLRLVEALSTAAGSAGERRAATDAVALYVAQNPTETSARRVLANLMLTSGDADAAVTTLGALADDLGGRDALLLAQLAYAYTAAGDPKSAAPFAAAAYRLQPMSPAASDAYGWALFSGGDTTAALQLLKKAVQIAPRHAGYRWHYAQALADARQIAAARASLAIALADPAFADRAAAQKLLAALAG